MGGRRLGIWGLGVVCLVVCLGLLCQTGVSAAPAKPKEKWQVALQRDFFKVIQLGDRAKALELLGYGASLNARNEQGDTPLHVAARAGDKEMVRFLLGRGADKTVRNNLKDTPMDTAAQAGRHDLAYLIRAYKPGGLPPLPPSNGPQPPRLPEAAIAKPAPLRKTELAGPRLVFPRVTEDSTLLYLNSGLPMDLNLGRGFVRLSAMVRLSKTRALAMGFLKKGEGDKPAPKPAFGHSEPEFWPYDRKILMAVQQFLAMVDYQPKRPLAQGQFVLRWPDQGKVHVLPMQREDLSRRLLGYLQEERGLTWVQEVLFTSFVAAPNE